MEQRLARSSEHPSPPPMFEGRLLPNPDEPVFDQGLGFDLETLLDRRRMLKLLGYGAGLAVLAARGVPGSTAKQDVGAQRCGIFVFRRIRIGICCG